MEDSLEVIMLADDSEELSCNHSKYLSFAAVSSLGA